MVKNIFLNRSITGKRKQQKKTNNSIQITGAPKNKNKIIAVLKIIKTLKYV